MNTPIPASMNERIVKNTVFQGILDSSRMAIADMPALIEWRSQCKLLETKIFEQSDELGREFEKVIWDGINLYSEAQFLMGWQLRDDPNKLFELPPGEI
jgi:hypothetical protein